MSVTLVTSFSPHGFISYGHRMLESALLHLPKSVRLHVYIEENPLTLLQSDLDFSGRRVRVENLYAIPGGVKDFLAKHGNDPKKWGKVPGRKDNFRWAICRFAHKMYAIFHASEHCKTDLLVWCDGDTNFFADVPESFFAETLPEPYYLNFLGRGTRYHPECGWFSMRTTHPRHTEFMQRYIDILRTGSFEREAEWHDSYLFGELVKQMTAEGKIATWNLSPLAIGPGHPWVKSPLAQFSDHCKGESRKIAGHSLPKDLIDSPRVEPYWQGIRKMEGNK